MKKILFPLFVSAAIFILFRAVFPSPVTQIHYFFGKYGFELSEVPIQTETVTLPLTLSPVYQNYNRLIASAKLDITPYLGKKVQRFTFAVKNFPFETASPVRANALVYRGKVIAADIMTVDIDGFMLSPADPIFSLSNT